MYRKLKYVLRAQLQCRDQIEASSYTLQNHLGFVYFSKKGKMITKRTDKNDKIKKHNKIITIKMNIKTITTNTTKCSA